MPPSWRDFTSVDIVNPSDLQDCLKIRCFNELAASAGVRLRDGE